MLQLIRVSAIFLFIFTVTSDAVEVDKQMDGNLTFVHVIYRHGDRTPIHTYPNDPWKNVSNWPVDWGQLTNIGKQQHYELGIWLRTRYNALIQKGYSRNLTYIQSTDVDRTLMSAQANLAGLFPPNMDQQWSSNLLWNPIPIHTTAEDLDWILAAKKPCPKYDLEYQQFVDSPEEQKTLQRFEKLMTFLTNATGQPIKVFEDVRSLYATLSIEAFYNKTLPEWTKVVFYPKSDMEWIMNYSFKQDVGIPVLQRLKSGFLLKEIFERFQTKSQGLLDPDRSLWIYSAHDTTVAYLLNALGIFEPHYPSYTACIMLELWMLNGTPFIKIFYKSLNAEPMLMKIPNCGERCQLSEMFKLYATILPNNFDDECDIPLLTKAMGSNAALIAAIAICLVLSTLILIIVFTKVCSKRFSRFSRLSF